MLAGQHYGWRAIQQLELVRPISRRQPDVEIATPEWPRYIAVDEEIERQANNVIRKAREYIIFRPSNGSARYRQVDRRPGQGLYILERGLVVTRRPTLPTESENCDSSPTGDN